MKSENFLITGLGLFSISIVALADPPIQIRRTVPMNLTETGAVTSTPVQVTDPMDTSATPYSRLSIQVSVTTSCQINVQHHLTVQADPNSHAISCLLPTDAPDARPHYCYLMGLNFSDEASENSAFATLPFGRCRNDESGVFETIEPVSRHTIIKLGSIWGYEPGNSVAPGEFDRRPLRPQGRPVYIDVNTGARIELASTSEIHTDNYIETVYQFRAVAPIAQGSNGSSGGSSGDNIPRGRRP